MSISREDLLIIIQRLNRCEVHSESIQIPFIFINFVMLQPDSCCRVLKKIIKNRAGAIQTCRGMLGHCFFSSGFQITRSFVWIHVCPHLLCVSPLS